MVNAYYRSEPDKLWDRFKEQSNGHDSFYDEVRDYLLEQYASNFTQFIEICSPPYCDLDYWEEMAEAKEDPREVIDNVFLQQQAEHQQRYIEGVVLSSAKISPIVPFVP